MARKRVVSDAQITRVARKVFLDLGTRARFLARAQTAFIRVPLASVLKQRRPH